ncbi:MAG: molybdate ABC transporter permease subunit [Alphaproteobacteria bacterium]|nr:molybdate ABC transporter permease subunit [Alphaproteobacteria bacterium]
MFLSADEVNVLILSLQVATWSVAASMVPAVAIGWLLARYDFPGKTALDAILHLPLVLPPVVVGYVLLVLFAPKGPLGEPLREWFGFSFAFSWRGAVLASAVMGFPLMTQAIRLSAQGVDRKLEQAARTLGAPPWQVFLTVTLPLMAPGVLAGTVLSFARSLGEFGATITFVSNIPGETRTLPLAIYTYTQVPGGEGPGLRLVLISVVVALLALAGAEFLNRALTRRIGVSG